MTAAALERVHRYEPRGSALELMHCRATEVLLSGPAGTGKSRACLEKLHLMCLANPGMKGLIVRKVRDSLASTALATYRQHVAKEAIDAGICWFYGGSAEEPPQYRYGNGSAIMLGGMDKPTKIMSSEYDVVYVQEAIELTVTDWENITTRLRNGVVSFQQLIADTNPDRPKHWLKDRCDRGDTKLIYCRHQDNPVYYHPDGTLTEQGAAYMATLDRLTGVRRLRLRDGKWVAAEGIIYGVWDEGVHLIDARAIPPDWERFWTVDFGFTNPFVLQCWAVDGDGRLYLYREIYRTKTLVEDHAKAILAAVRRCAVCCKSKAADHDCQDCKACRLEWTEPRPRAVICDHDAEDRATLERHLGMSTTPARKTVSDGIQAVQTRMRVAKDGRPRIFVMRGEPLGGRDPDLDEEKKPCSTAEEISGYVWAVKPGGEAKEEPLKKDDHGCDAMRYAVAEADLGRRPQYRSFRY
jgi:phage terminase large subunit